MVGERIQPEFQWKRLGNIQEGRAHLGPEMPVYAYRLMQYTMRDVLVESYGEIQADELFRQAGYQAGLAYAQNMLPLNTDLATFFGELQKTFKDSKLGIIRVEKTDLEQMEFVLTVGEDLDCSGLPVTDETVCVYDEGFIAGVFEAYTQKVFEVREIDCWASGERVCRFSIKPR